MSLTSFGALATEFYKTTSFRNKRLALLMSITDRTYALVWAVVFFIALIFSLSFKFPVFISCILSAFSYITLVVLVLVTNHLLRKWFKSLRILKHVEFLRWIVEENEVSGSILFKHALYTASYLIVTYFVYSIILLSFSIPVDIAFLIYVPLLTILLTLPISIQGLGIREFVLLQYATAHNLDASIILSASLGIFFVGITYRLFGLIPFFILKEKY